VAGRELLVLRWDARAPGSAYGYQHLVLETSLLPDHRRRALTR
jgi:hypothetical protein